MVINQISRFLLLCFFAVSTLYAEPSITLPSVKAELSAAKSTDLGINHAGIGLTSGSHVPDFSVNTHDGKATTIGELLEQGQLMVVFYRGGWCPYCNVQIRELTEAWLEFQQRNITPVLISVDNTDASSLAQRTYEIPFPVLSDPDLKAHMAFDVVLDVDQNNYEKYLAHGLDLEQWSGRGHHKMAVPSVFIIDTAGTVQWAHTNLDYKTRPSPQQLLTVIDELRVEAEVIQ